MPPTTSRRRSEHALTDDEFLDVLDARGQDPSRIGRGVPRGGREDLADKEEAEIAILAEYLPQALTEAEIDALVDEGDRRDRRDVRPRPGQGHGLALTADPRPRRRQGRERAASCRPSPGPTSPPTTAAHWPGREPTMLTQRAERSSALHAQRCRRGSRSRRGILILVLTAILGADLLPKQTLDVQAAATRAARHRRAARARRSTARSRPPRPHGGRARSRPPQYDFTTENAIAIAAEQAGRVRAARRAGSTPRSRPRSRPRTGAEPAPDAPSPA